MTDTSAWVSVELYDNTLTECLIKWNHNKWGVSKEMKSNIEELFFYGITINFNGETEIFHFTDGYIFLKLKDKTKLPPISKIHGAIDFVKSGPRESTEAVIYFDAHKIKDIKLFVKDKLSKVTDPLKEGKKAKVIKGLYRGMEGIIDKKEGIYVHLSFYLNSRTFSEKMPFWFLHFD